MRQNAVIKMDEPNLAIVHSINERMINNVSKVIVGKSDAIELCLIGLLCQGHLLIEDIPGVGKTMLATSIARTMGCSFNRIQFTPDMLPGDIIGFHTYNKFTGKTTFRPGPIMAQMVLIDEVNRASPKVQAALLEAMEEHQVTIDNVSYPLPSPFMILATENRLDTRATYSLPNSQLDRFFLQIQLGYPDPQEEIRIIHNQQFRHPMTDLTQTIPIEDLFHAQSEIKKVYVSPAVMRYIVEILDQSRHHPDIFLGGSPRASFALYRACQARAAIQGRNYALPDDVKALIIPAIRHRILLSPRAYLHKRDVEKILEEILETVPIPGDSLRLQRSKRRSPLNLAKPPSVGTSR
jgi:MoxR-like ATPase